MTRSPVGQISRILVQTKNIDQNPGFAVAFILMKYTGQLLKTHCVMEDGEIGFI